MNLFIKIITIIVMSLVVFGNAINFSSAEEKTSTGETEEVKTLVLNGVEVVGKKTVELKFAKEILDNDEKDIIVRLLGDSPKEIFVLDFDIKDNSVKLILEEELESNKDYEVVIFSITGKDGSTITSGLDGAIKFSSGDLSRFDKKEVKSEDNTGTIDVGTDEEKTNENEEVKNGTGVEDEVEANLESASSTEPNKTNADLNGEKLSSEGNNENGNNNNGNNNNGSDGNNLNTGTNDNGNKGEVGQEPITEELNSGVEGNNLQENSSEENKNNLGGENVTKEEMDKNIEVAAGDKKELVKTGPENILLLVLSLMLAGLIGYTFKSKKNG